jgi:GDP-4-dehydro-6-deoxy-D-mannose reductase
VGKHLTCYLAGATSNEFYGIARDGEFYADLECDLGPRVHIYNANLMDGPRVREIVAEVRPDWIFHLAAQASVATAWTDPLDTLVNNIAGQVNLTEAVLAWGGNPTMLVICSNEEYGVVSLDELPIKETAQFRPPNPYAVSKVAQDMLGYQYHVSHGMAIIRVRPFNHTGPGQSDKFVCSAFARQIAEAEMGLRPPVIKVGNLEAERDFTDVRDIVRGYHVAVLRGQAGEVYNLGSERAVTIRHVLDLLLAHSRIPIQVEADPALLRPADIPRVVADCSKFRALTGWRAEIPLERTLADLLDSWRKRLQQSAT